MQLVDTSIVANHAKGANDLFIGVEFESIAGDQKLSWGARLPSITNDPLTAYQCNMGWEVMNWISQRIPMIGPPTLAEVKACRGRWHGFMSHWDAHRAFPTPLAEDILDWDYALLGIWPSAFLASPD